DCRGARRTHRFSAHRDVVLHHRDRVHRDHRGALAHAPLAPRCAVEHAMSAPARASSFAPFRVRSYRYQWPADLSTSWAFEMETLILGWYILVETRSVQWLAVFASLQYTG